MEFYHVLNRGVDKREVVSDDGDRMRFVRSLFIYNDFRPAPNFSSQSHHWNDWKRNRDTLVHVHAWCLMDNHYHMLLSPVNGDEAKLVKFMRKLNMGYAKFFNEKHNRSGYLWQGRYKKILVERDNYFHYIPHYIHLNPLDLQYPMWREGGVVDCASALGFLDSYRWSSYQDYLKKENFPSVIDTSVLASLLGTRNELESEVRNLITNPELTSRYKNLET